MNEFRTPIPVEVDGKGPALAIGSVSRDEWVVIAKDGGGITIEAIGRLKATSVYVAGPAEPPVARAV